MRVEEGRGRKAVVLWSGGVDSTTCLYLYLQAGWFVKPIFFDYGQLAEKEELSCVVGILQALKQSKYGPNVGSLYQQKVYLYGHLLTGGPEVVYKEGYRSAIVPMRNTIFSTIGYYYARNIKASCVVIGSHIASKESLVSFPDCTPEWTVLMGRMFDHENQSCGDTEPPVEISTPIINMRKPEIVELAKGLGVTAYETWGCYFPVDNKPCGYCEVCCLRKDVGLDR